MKRSALAALLLLTGCDSPVRVDPAPSLDAALSIVDGTEPRGVAGFYWRKPIVEHNELPAVGVFDPSVLPGLAVEVCAWDGSACASPLVARFTSEEGTGGERIRIKDADEPDAEVGPFYDVRWREGTDLDPDGTYRIRVRFGDAELGHADVDVVLDAKEEKAVDRAHFIPLRAGKQLSIRFTVTDAMDLGGVIGADGGRVELRDGNVLLDVPEGALPGETPLTVQVLADPGDLPDGPPPVGGLVFDFGPDGTTFAEPVTMTLSFDPSALAPDVDPAELRIHKIVDGAYVQEDAGVVDVDNRTVSAWVDGFSRFVVIPRDLRNDREPPILRAIEVFDEATQSWGPATTLSTGAGDAPLRTRVWVTDDVAGLWLLNYFVESPSGGQTRVLCTSVTLTLVSGSDTNGWWECPQVWPQYTENGVFQPGYISIIDNGRGLPWSRRFYEVTESGSLCAVDDPAECAGTRAPIVTVATGPEDVTPPVTPSSISVGLGSDPGEFSAALSVTSQSLPQTVTFRFDAQDDLSGVIEASPREFAAQGWTRILMTTSTGSVWNAPCKLSSGTPQSGTFDCSLTIPEGTAVSTWTALSFDLSDRVWNRRSFRSDAPGQLCTRQEPIECVVEPPVVTITEGPVCAAGEGTTATLVDAINQAASGDTLRICGGTHDLSSLSSVSKSLHLIGVGPTKPVISPGPFDYGIAGEPFTIDNVEIDRAAVQVRGSEVNLRQIVVRGQLRTRIDRIGNWRVEDSDFDRLWVTGPSGGSPGSIEVVGNRIGPGLVQVDEDAPSMVFTDNQISCVPANSCVRLTGSLAPSIMFTGNQISCTPTTYYCVSMSAPTGMGTVDFRRNTVECAGQGACLSFEWLDAQVIDNTLRQSNVGPQPRVVLFPNSTPGTSVVRGNVIRGVRASPDDPYPFGSLDCAACGEFSGNTIDGVARVSTPQGPATDLVMDDVGDLFAYGPIRDSDLSGVARVSAHAGADLTCNWWGDADLGPRAPTGAYSAWMPFATPWATAPVANGAGGACDGTDFEPVPVANPLSYPLLFQDIWGEALGNRFWAVAGDRYSYPSQGAVFSYDAVRGTFVADSSGPFIEVNGLPPAAAGADLVGVDGRSSPTRVFAASQAQPLSTGYGQAQVLRLTDSGSPGKWKGTNTWGVTAPGRMPGSPKSAEIPVGLNDVAAGGTEVVAVGYGGTAYRLVEAPCDWCLVPSGEYWTPLLTPTVNGTHPNLRAVYGQGLTTIAVGDGGTILRKIRGDSEGPECNPAFPVCTVAWVQESSPVSGDLVSVFALPDGTWLAGTVGGLLLERSNPFDGSWHVRADYPGSGTIYAIWGTAQDDLFVLGGTLQYLGPSGWTNWGVVGLGTGTGIWGSSDGTVVMVTDGDRILRRFRKR